MIDCTKQLILCKFMQKCDRLSLTYRIFSKVYTFTSLVFLVTYSLHLTSFPDVVLMTFLHLPHHIV